MTNTEHRTIWFLTWFPNRSRSQWLQRKSCPQASWHAWGTEQPDDLQGIRCVLTGLPIFRGPPARWCGYVCSSSGWKPLSRAAAAWLKNVVQWNQWQQKSTRNSASPKRDRACSCAQTRAGPVFFSDELSAKHPFGGFCPNVAPSLSKWTISYLFKITCLMLSVHNFMHMYVHMMVRHWSVVLCVFLYDKNLTDQHQ